MQRKRIDVETCKARLEDIEARLKLGKLNAAEADAERLALLCQLRSSSWGFGQNFRRAVPRLIGPAAVFLLVAGVGAAVSNVRGCSRGRSARSSGSSELGASGLGSDGEMLASLADYTRRPSEPKHQRLHLPVAFNGAWADVDTMIERLAARLATEGRTTCKGWGTLGWSYFQMERYERWSTAAVA